MSDQPYVLAETGSDQSYVLAGTGSDQSYVLAETGSFGEFCPSYECIMQKQPGGRLCFLWLQLQRAL